MLRRPSPGKPELKKGENQRPGDDSFYYVYVCIKDPTKVRLLGGAWDAVPRA